MSNFPFSISAGFFAINEFRINNVDTKTFILTIAQNNPRSFISGSEVDLSSTLVSANRNEFHHLMPKNAIKRGAMLDAVFDFNLPFTEYDGGTDRILSGTGRAVLPLRRDCLANFCFMSRSDNRRLGGDLPSVYRRHLAPNLKDVIASALCPAVLFEDKFGEFLQDRSIMLYEFAKILCNVAEFENVDIENYLRLNE